MLLQQLLQENNLGGNRDLAAVEIDSSVTLVVPPDDSLVVSTAITATNQSQLYGIFETISFDQKQEDTEAGTRYKITVKAMIAKLNSDDTSWIYKKKEVGFLLVCRDNNGNKRIVGDIENGTRMTTDESSGTKVADRNCYVATFYCEQSHPAYFYTA